MKEISHLLHHLKKYKHQYLKYRFRHFEATVPHNKLRNTWTEVKHRQDIVCANRGAHSLIC